MVRFSSNVRIQKKSQFKNYLYLNYFKQIILLAPKCKTGNAINKYISLKFQTIENQQNINKSEINFAEDIVEYDIWCAGDVTYWWEKQISDQGG